ncbi:MAG: hypothetical protein RIM72_00290 [Alphaproteobacteria bacterium]
MSDQQSEANVREAVGVFNNADSLVAAIDELQSSGFDRAEISLLASESAVQEKLGHMYEKVSDLEDDPAAPRTAYVSTESIGDAKGSLIGGLIYVGAMAAVGSIVASGGSLGIALIGATALGGTGGFIGAILAEWVGKHHADFLQEQLDHGGLILWVRTRDETHEKRATKILSSHSAYDVHVHGRPNMSS